jgi:hypothetical protein
LLASGLFHFCKGCEAEHKPGSLCPRWQAGCLTTDGATVHLEVWDVSMPLLAGGLFHRGGRRLPRVAHHVSMPLVAGGLFHWEHPDRPFTPDWFLCPWWTPLA